MAGLRELGYGWYVRRLRAQLAGAPLPRHVGVIMDGNRRWARQRGNADLSHGHRSGAEQLDQLLGWCAGLGVDQVTVFVASIDNLRRRETREVDLLMGLAER